MQNWEPLLLVIAVFVANLPALMQQWRTDRAGSIKTLWLLAVYLLYCPLSVALVLWLLWTIDTGRGSQWEPVAITGIVAGLILYGALTLMRVVPRYREPPRWLMRFGIADVILIGLMFGCLALFRWA